MYFIWKLHVRVPFIVLSSPTHTHLSQRCFHFFKQSWYGFQLLCSICLNLRNRLKSSSFEGLFKFWEQEKVSNSKARWVGVRVGRTVIKCLIKNSRVLSAEWAGAMSWWKIEKPVVTSPRFWSFVSEGVPQTFQYFNVVNLVAFGALRKILVVNNTLSI